MNIEQYCEMKWQTAIKIWNEPLVVNEIANATDSNEWGVHKLGYNYGKHNSCTYICYKVIIWN